MTRPPWWEWDIRDARAMIAADTLAALVAAVQAGLPLDEVLSQAGREIDTLTNYFGVQRWRRWRG